MFEWYISISHLMWLPDDEQIWFTKSTAPSSFTLDEKFFLKLCNQFQELDQ